MLSNKEKYKTYRPKKFLGQNFLVDDNIAGKIVRSLSIKNNEPVLEIGPGYGSLTRHILNLTKNYIAVEIDKNIVSELTKKFPGIEILHSDILKFDFNALKKFKYKIKIIGNLPYNITSEIIFKLFENREKISEAVIMVQNEVADRILGTPNSKNYGILSVQSQYFSQPVKLFKVPPSAFFPKPKVYSAIVKLKFVEIKDGAKDEKSFKTIVRESFGKRRKTMKNSLKEFFEKQNLHFGEINFDFSRRPENVTVREFIFLTNEIYEQINEKAHG